MFPAFPTRVRALLAVAAVFAAAHCAQALEHVTLANGFSYDCSRHEALEGARVRLFLLASDGSQTQNFIDRPTGEIVGFETLPDPPKPTVPASAVPVASAEPTIAELLDRIGREHHIDATLLFSVIKAESNFHPNATSRAGARGLMQLMPGTAHDLGVTDITRIDQNIAGGAAYLDYLLTRYKDDVVKALAAYNAGPEAVDRYHGVPPYRETREYVNRVIGEFNRRKAALATTTVASK